MTDNDSVADKPPTLREQIRSVDNSVKMLAVALKDATVTTDAATTVPEADALAACMRALTQLEEWQNKRRGGSYTYTASALSPGDEAIDRVLHHLAQRYNVPLIDVQTEPCSRRHLDELQPHNFVQALNIAAGAAS